MCARGCCFVSDSIQTASACGVLVLSRAQREPGQASEVAAWSQGVTWMGVGRTELKCGPKVSGSCEVWVAL